MVTKVSGHTLLKIEDLEKIGKQSASMGSFLSHLTKYKIQEPVVMPAKLPSLPKSHEELLKKLGIDYFSKIPESLSDLLNRDYKVTTSFTGGETKAMASLKEYLKDKKKVLTFEKP